MMGYAILNGPKNDGMPRNVSDMKRMGMAWSINFISFHNIVTKSYTPQ